MWELAADLIVEKKTKSLYSSLPDFDVIEPELRRQLAAIVVDDEDDDLFQQNADDNLDAIRSNVHTPNKSIGRPSLRSYDSDV